MSEYDAFAIPKIQDAWEAAGRPPCDPHVIAREYIPNIGRADYYCQKCGASNPDREVLRARLGLA